MVVAESGSDLSDLITDRGIDIQEEAGDFMDDCPGLDPGNHESEQPQSPDLASEPEFKPPNGFRACRSDQLRRPPESERQRSLLEARSGWVQPADPDVVAHTALVKPGEEGEVRFTAPPSGTYQFVCTFPGHNFAMFGDFVVTP